MIEIEVFRQQEQINGFRISGHADLKRRGKDICCAAVSAISQTALLGLLGQLENKPKYQFKDGWLEVSIAAKSSTEDLQKAQIILSTMEAGLRWIADDYPQIIRLKTDQQSGADEPAATGKQAKARQNTQTGRQPKNRQGPRTQLKPQSDQAD